MDELHSILARHKGTIKEQHPTPLTPPIVEVPELFFDEILRKLKLGRQEIMVLFYLYRKTWTRSNPNRKFGIGKMLSYEEMAVSLGMSIDDLYQSLRKLESLDLIETIRSGQYFVRKYFTKENDQRYQVSYENFQ